MKKLIKILCVSINETFLEGLKNALKSQNLELTFFLLKEDNNDELTKLTSDIDILVLHIHETIDHEFIQKFIKDEFKIMIIGPKTLNNISTLIKNKINGYIYSEDTMQHIVKAITLLTGQENSFSNAVAQDLLNYSELYKYVVERERLLFYDKYKPTIDINRVVKKSNKCAGTKLCCC